MSLYGPRISLPKLDIPNPASPSWNLEKEKKLIIGIIALLIILGIIMFAGPVIVSTFSKFIENSLNPSVKVEWKNNPLDLTNGIREAELDLILVNTSEEIKEVTFNITTNSEEVIIFCPNSIYDSIRGAYILENLAPKDKRKIPCILRRNPDESVFTGTYTIDITTSMGNTKTTLEVISK